MIKIKEHKRSFATMSNNSGPPPPLPSCSKLENETTLKSAIKKYQAPAIIVHNTQGSTVLSEYSPVKRTLKMDLEMKNDKALLPVMFE